MDVNTSCIIVLTIVRQTTKINVLNAFEINDLLAIKRLELGIVPKIINIISDLIA